jgi:hypothetical protein
MSLGGKLTALVCHPNQKVNKAEEQTYLSKNFDCDTLSNKPDSFSFVIGLNHLLVSFLN